MKKTELVGWCERAGRKAEQGLKATRLEEERRPVSFNFLSATCPLCVLVLHFREASLLKCRNLLKG